MRITRGDIGNQRLAPGAGQGGETRLDARHLRTAGLSAGQRYACPCRRGPRGSPAGSPPSAGCDKDMHRSEEHTSELQSLAYLVCRLLLEKKKQDKHVQLRSELTQSND